MEPLAYPAHVGDGHAFGTVEPGPGVFDARDKHHSRYIVVDYSDPDQSMVYIND
jgi:hypothetical protein